MQVGITTSFNNNNQIRNKACRQQSFGKLDVNWVSLGNEQKVTQAVAGAVDTLAAKFIKQTPDLSRTRASIGTLPAYAAMDKGITKDAMSKLVDDAFTLQGADVYIRRSSDSLLEGVDVAVKRTGEYPSDSFGDYKFVPVRLDDRNGDSIVKHVQAQVVKHQRAEAKAEARANKKPFSVGLVLTRARTIFSGLL